MTRLHHLAAAVFVLTAATASASIVDTVHNLSTSGPGTIKAVSEDRVCVFCHTPHNASAAAQLWNRADPAGPHTPYTSSTMNAAPGQPTGSSRLCLSCHDGTIALGATLTEDAIAMAGGVTTMPRAPPTSAPVCTTTTPCRSSTTRRWPSPTDSSPTPPA